MHVHQGNGISTRAVSAENKPRIAPDEHRLQHLKYEGVIDEEAAALKKQRADRRGSLRRAQLEQLLTKLEADGTSSIAIFTTRPLNRRVLASSAADGLLTSVPGLNKEADADLVSRWRGFRLLHKATNAELKGYLERRGLPYYASSKSALLARVAADLIKNHPDGGLEPPSAPSERSTVTTTASASEQPQQRRQKRAKVSKNTGVQQQAAASIADQT
ncbi:hypothetical protein COCOBI_04-1090 [Coccomyxa sp. Obi]|nr:hypothetical protein COCOBI_04-1090 [Coccomyxa sp. Obi]